MESKRIEEAIFMFIFVLRLFVYCNSVPLSTSSRWIVDRSTGKRVKLACANWASHLQPMIAEGLEKKPITVIARKIIANGFNCVRFTWATFMFTRPDYYNLTVSESLDRYNLTAAKSGIAKNNPRILNMKILELHVAVVKELGKHNLMVVLDNHVSKPGWCCAPNDRNGFWGDADFDPGEWALVLAAVAKMYKGNSMVVGMSLRNELHGPRQNEPDWYKYMRQGANAVHEENPDLLVIISGMVSDTRLGFLRKRPLDLKLNNKLVYEAHWYTFNIPTEAWTDQTNIFCARMTNIARNNYLFLTTGNNSFPLFLSEFGIDQRGGNEGQNRHITCLLAEVAGRDIDWALWAFQGSYMLRQGVRNLDEVFGVMDLNWNGPRNRDFIRRLQIIRELNQEPTSRLSTYYKIFHPQSGLCVVISSSNNNHAILANCKMASRWDQHKDGAPMKMKGSPRCLAVRGEGAAIGVSNDCSSKWKYVSSTGLHLAVQNGEGKYLCLEKNASNNSTFVTNKCLCVRDDLVDLPICADNPQVQWFKFVPANV